MAATRTRYATIAIVLHWLIAAAIVFQILLGWRMEDEKGPTGYAVFQLHKSIGITILALSLARLAWRLTHRPPPLPADMPRWEVLAAKASHWGFYVIMIGMPLTGWAMVSASPTHIPTVLFHTIPWPHLPLLPDLAPAAKKAWYAVFSQGHHLLAFLTYGLLVLHVGAALKHHLVNRDAVLGHMLPGARRGSWLDPRLWLVPLAALGVIGGAYAYGPAARAPAPAGPPPAPPAAPAPAPVPAPAAQSPAATPPPPVEAPLAVPSKWTVSPGSALKFSADWSGTPIDGQFRRWDADILFSPEALDASRLKVTVDMTSGSTGDDQRDATLPSADWFGASDHPKAVFTASRFEKTAEGRFVARGRLQLRGVTAPLNLPFTLKIAGDKATVTGSGTINRTTFGVGQGEWASTDQVLAPVKVTFALTATRD